MEETEPRILAKCLKQYMELAIQEGCGSPITCPDMVCLNHGTLQEAEIACLVPVDQFELYKRLKFEREVHLDPQRTWCPTADCQTVCHIAPSESGAPVPVECPACHLTFCSSCKEPWHGQHLCQENQTALVAAEQGFLIGAETESPIKQCPVCRIYIERNEGCAQMMCKNCKHTFCWYCLQNLDNDIFLRHYDRGPCRNKLGHSRASVMWNRTQVCAAAQSLAWTCSSLVGSLDRSYHGETKGEFCHEIGPFTSLLRVIVNFFQQCPNPTLDEAVKLSVCLRDLPSMASRMGEAETLGRATFLLQKVGDPFPQRCGSTMVMHSATAGPSLGALNSENKGLRGVAEEIGSCLCGSLLAG
ncbi:hypothetical protein DUI87_08412 [Hirundo rustica rustica]|uniref:E3 ubiquitin-protein ligase RNF144B n=1 Tax=Hirundo rustica rustica TaxID=333673 RepID=A0A3M0KSC9_HIRRU|nr:hypothetical protein DUI87_08412 [Hirundo rustica rustica]